MIMTKVTPTIVLMTIFTTVTKLLSSSFLLGTVEAVNYSLSDEGKRKATVIPRTRLFDNIDSAAVIIISVG